MNQLSHRISTRQASLKSAESKRSRAGLYTREKVRVEAETVFKASEELTLQGPEADDFQNKVGQLRQLVDYESAIREAQERAKNPSREEIIEDVTRTPDLPTRPKVDGGPSSSGYFIERFFSAEGLATGVASNTPSVQAVKKELAAKEQEYEQREANVKELQLIAEATELAVPIDNVRDLALQFDGLSSDQDGSLDGNVIIDSPDRNRWWHGIADALYPSLQPDDTLRGEFRSGGRIEVGQDGERSWTLTPIGNSYSNGNDTIYVENGTGYQFASDKAEKLEGETLANRLEQMGFPQASTSEELNYVNTHRIKGLFAHEKEQSNPGMFFNQALKVFSEGS